MKKSKSLPQYDVFLMNDDVNQALVVAKCVKNVMHFNKLSSLNIVKEANNAGKALLITTHQERAECIVAEFDKLGVTVNMNKALSSNPGTSPGDCSIQ